ncbi:transglycosylase domain-containing protein [Streptacidiphilus melanogenes]|uniref:transglycosylase domain-containing protein n=1 Tax=Streptacidiphilus melanogenes TaxID=411235 RepID=UPI00069392D6|nr:transglycosylase domain-containing protein [Streptacidiphilus melanogenes]
MGSNNKGMDDPDSLANPMTGGTLEAEDRAEGGGMGASGRDRRRARTAARKARRRALPWYRRIIPTWRMALGGLLTAVLLGVGAFVGIYLYVEPPNANAAAVAQANVYYYSDGKTVIGQTGTKNRMIVPLAQISPQMQQAAVSAEDRTFYSNQGVSLTGMARAAWDTARGQGVQGGSTITQQYVKNYYLNQDQTVSRKIKEFFISLKVDRTETKSDILAGYLNTSYFGRGAYGVQAAAQAYFGVNASQLNADQSAYLAALLQAPSAYDVATASAAGKQAATDRWNYVLDGMAKLGYLTPQQRAAAKFPAVKPTTGIKGLSGQAGYLVDIADNYLFSNNVMTRDELARGGWKIVTTFDKGDQNALASSVKHELNSLKTNSAKAKYIRAGAASVEPSSGKVVAAYGGPDYVTQPFNDALRTDISEGSTFKAFDLAAALQNKSTTQDGRQITPYTTYDGTSGRQVVGLPPNVASFNPDNEDHVNYGQISVSTAMAKSVNSVFAQLGADVGLDKVRAAAIAAGLPSDTPGMSASNPSVTLGTSSPNAIQLAGAYATFANHGKQIAPWSVQSVSHEGQSKTMPQHTATQAFDRSVADTVTQVLQGVIDNGTGYAAQALGRDAAGKTGTTDSNLSAWFAGYTPQLSTTVGLFAQQGDVRRISLGDAAGISRVNGGSFPTQIWTNYMEQALSGLPYASFDLQTGSYYVPPVTTPSVTPSPSATTPASPTPTPPTPSRTPVNPYPTVTPSNPPYTPPVPNPTPSTPTAPPTSQGNGQGNILFPRHAVNTP